MDKSYQKVASNVTDLIAEGFRTLSDGYQPLKDTPKFLDEFLSIPSSIEGFKENFPNEAVQTTKEEDAGFWDSQIKKVSDAIIVGQPETSEDDAYFKSSAIVLPLRQSFSVYSTVMRSKN